MRNLINVLMIVVMVVFVGNVCADIIDIPVEVPADKLPNLSKATHPTVPSF